MNIQANQLEQFTTGYLEAMKWSTGGESDFSETPDGYVVLHMYDDTWKVSDKDGAVEPVVAYKTERQAIAAAWKRSGLEPPTLDSLDGFDIEADSLETLRAHCRAFFHLNYAALYNYARRMDGQTLGCASVWEHAGHDFWLTSAGHGAGFWDCGLDDLEDQLVDASQPYHTDVYLGDDGLIHV